MLIFRRFLWLQNPQADIAVHPKKPREFPSRASGSDRGAPFREAEKLMANAKWGRFLVAFCLKWGFNQTYYPIGSMYGIFTYINHKNQPNVGK